MGEHALPLLVDGPPPANLADLLALRGQALHAPSPAPARSGAWERWRWGMQRLQARFATHPCRGASCAKCGEFYRLDPRAHLNKNLRFGNNSFLHNGLQGGLEQCPPHVR